MELQAIYNQRLARIRELEKQLGKQQSNYRVMKGDAVDELLANYLSISGCPIPIRRLGEGFYMFGSRKIYAKIMNGKLVIRVGGGYMIIEKFIETYADQEIEKLKRIAEKQGLSDWTQLDFNQFGPQSPTSSTAKVNSKLSGSSRPKTLTASQMQHARTLK